MIDESALNGQHQEEPPKFDILKKFGIDVSLIPEDCRGFMILTDSPSKGTNVASSTINDRIIASGMLDYVKEVLKRHWLNQDMAIKQQMMQSQALQDQILNPNVHRRG